MNHISTLTITKQYIEQQIRRISRENNDDVLNVMMSMMAAVDERFRVQEAAIHKVNKRLSIRRSAKDESFENTDFRH